MSHLYLNEESDHSEENTCENEVFCCRILHHTNKLNILTPQLPIYYVQYQNRKSWLEQMPVRKKVFFKISQNLQETLMSKKTPVSFSNFLRKSFLQNNSGRLLLKCRHCQNGAREIDCLCCREVDAMLIISAKILEHEGSISLSRFYEHLTDFQSHVLALSTW